MTDVVIGMPVYGRVELALAGLRALDAHTPIEIGLIVVDDCGPVRLAEADVRAQLAAERPCTFVAHESNQGYVGSVNDIFGRAGRTDVIVMNSDVQVLPGWFEALAGAICEGPTTVASASTMADNGGILSIPELATAAAADPQVLERLRAEVTRSAEIPVAVAHCTWFTRAAIDRVGEFDQRLAPGYGEEVDWSLRACDAGFTHRAALHSYVRHAGSASFGAARGLLSLQRRHEALLLWRYRRRWFALRRFARDDRTELAIARMTIARFLAGMTAEGSGRADPAGPSS